jgi:diacylglycerol kinase family enzyme
MKSIGIILNPSARINKTKTAYIIEELQNIFGKDAMVCPTSGKEEIPEVIERFHQEDIKFLLISGGDGTIKPLWTRGAPYHRASYGRHY